MDRNDTNGHTDSGRALVPLGRATQSSRTLGGRPMASFLTHLLVACEPSLRASRSDRTRDAAEAYRTQARRGV